MICSVDKFTRDWFLDLLKIMKQVTSVWAFENQQGDEI